MPQTKTRKGNIGKSLSEVSVISEVSAFSTWPSSMAHENISEGLSPLNFKTAYRIFGRSGIITTLNTDCICKLTIIAFSALGRAVAVKTAKGTLVL